jgi:carbon catabolite-derepressing protein kinase
VPGLYLHALVVSAKANITTANLSDDKGQLLFQAPSPPAWNDSFKLDSVMSSTPSQIPRRAPSEPSEPSPVSIPIRPSPRVDAVSPRSTSTNSTEKSIHPYQSKIGVLPSSLTPYHRAFMEARKSGKPMETPLTADRPEDKEQHPQTEAEKVETARRLNPHSKSQIKLDEASKRPAGMTPVPPKKPKPTKWQFGIRSRNQPLEAIGCIYRALQKLGAEWVLDEEYDVSGGSHEGDG